MKHISRKYRWSTEVMIITVLGMALIAGGTVLVLASPGAPHAVKGIIVTVIVVPVLWVAGWTPVSLSAGGDGLVLKKLWGSITVPAGEIVSVRIIDSQDLRWSLRTFGSGGLFGYLGRFWNKPLGHYTMYITERRNLLLVETTTRTYVFNGTEEFLTVLGK